MSIYSLNDRYDELPVQASVNAIAATLVRFDDLELIQDRNEGPFAVFYIIYTGSDALTANFTAARVNGFDADVFETVALNASGTRFLILVGAALGASMFNVELTLGAARTGALNLLGYSFGNVGVIAYSKAAGTALTSSGGSLEILGPGEFPLTDSLIFTAGGINSWAASATRTVAVTTTPDVLTMPISESFNDAVGVDGRASFYIGPMTDIESFYWTVVGAAGFIGAAVFIAEPLPDQPGDFNCACSDESDNETLAQLRRRLLVRLGYSAQADSPPPGMADLLDDFLVQAQRFLYRKYRALRTERFFTWTMIAGERFYDLPDNDESCDKVLDPYRLSWVGVEDLNGTWHEMGKGIPPEVYTSIANQGIPAIYEIHQCIEVFPAPADNYKLRIKGHFGLTQFDLDTDKTTIDSELVFMWALSNAKAHYGQSDAANIAAQANTYLGTLVSGSHQTARYVPNSGSMPPRTKPLFLG